MTPTTDLQKPFSDDDLQRLANSTVFLPPGSSLVSDLAAEVIRLQDDFNIALADAKDSHKMWTDCKEKLADAEAENKRLREIIRRDTLADAVRACEVYGEWCQNCGRNSNLLAAVQAANEIAEMLPRLPEIRHIEDDEEAAKAIYSIDPKWISKQAKSRAALKGGEI
jgi:hypothetical protein